MLHYDAFYYAAEQCSSLCLRQTLYTAVNIESFFPTLFGQHSLILLCLLMITFYIFRCYSSV